MKNIYTVTGMTCNGCKSKVESLLNSLESVEEVSVDLETSQVSIVSKEVISIEELAAVLPEKYTIASNEKQLFSNATEIQKKSDLKELFPLFLIFVYITSAAILLNKSAFNWSNFMLDFMGLFYVVFSFFKFLDYKGFPTSFSMYDPLAKVVPAYGFIYPFIEVALGLMFLMRFEITSALIATIIVLGITTIGVTKTLLDKKSIQCACLGTALKLPMTKATFIENTIMIVMALIMLVNTLN